MKHYKDLYKILSKDISNIIYKHLQENTNNLQSYLDKNGCIDMSSSEKVQTLPKSIIKNLIEKILETCTYEKEQINKNMHREYHIIAMPEYTNDITDDIYLNTINDYGLGLEFDVEYDFDFTPGWRSNDYDLPDDPDEYNLELNNIYDIKLTDDMLNTLLIINDKELHDMILDDYQDNDDDIESDILDDCLVNVDYDTETKSYYVN